MVLPVLALGLFGSASIMRQTRSSILEVMSQDYMTTARAKGLASREVIIRHGLRNALIPIITVAAFQVSGLIGGSVLVERVFAIPGFGRLAVEAMQPTAPGRAKWLCCCRQCCNRCEPAGRRPLRGCRPADPVRVSISSQVDQGGAPLQRALVRPDQPLGQRSSLFRRPQGCGRHDRCW